MRPYLLEGLDCSGKKTLARAVTARLAECGYPTQVTIGPLVGGPLGRLDDALANRTRHLPAGSALGRFRRLVYVVGPLADGLAYHAAPHDRLVKVSSHFRAWARARIDRDALMDRTFTITRALHVRYGGATLLHTDFAVRLDRHRADVAAGRTRKHEHLRFLGPDPTTFDCWHATLDALLDQEIGRIQRLDTSSGDLAAHAEQIVAHVLGCWRAEAIACPW